MKTKLGPILHDLTPLNALIIAIVDIAPTDPNDDCLEAQAFWCFGRGIITFAEFEMVMDHLEALVPVFNAS